MAVGFVNSSDLGSLMIDYLEKLRERKRHFGIEVDKFFLLLIDSWMEYDNYHSFNKLCLYLLSILKQERITRPGQLFEKRLRDFPEFMMDKQNAILFRFYISHLMDYSFDDRNYRPFRSKKIEYYLENVMALLQYFVIFSAIRSAEDKYLNEEFYMTEKENWFCPFIKHWWAAHIMAGNENMIQFLKEVLSKEETASCLSSEQYSGIVLSGHRELIDMMIKLIDSPKLKGNPRKRMVDSFRYSSSRTFVYFLAAVCESPKMQQQACVKKQMAYWIGMDDRSSSKHITQEVIFYTAELLSDKEHLQTALESGKAFDYYMAFWAISFYSLEKVLEMGPSIIQGDDREKVQVFFLFINTSVPKKKVREFAKMALPLWYQDTEVLATFIGEYLADASYYDWKVNDERRPRLADCYNSLEEARSHYDLLKSLHPQMKTRYEFPSPVFPFRNLCIWNSNLVHQMCNIAFVTGDQQMLDEVLTRLNELGTYGRDMFLCHLGLAKSSSSKYYIW